MGFANYDESIFTDPKRFDVTHKNLRHLGFETGIHFCFCLGASSFTWIIILSLRFQSKNNLIKLGHIHFVLTYYTQHTGIEAIKITLQT